MPLLGDSFADDSFRCTSKQMLLHLMEDMWNAMLSTMKQALEAGSTIETKSRNFGPFTVLKLHALTYSRLEAIASMAKSESITPFHATRGTESNCEHIGYGASCCCRMLLRRPLYSEADLYLERTQCFTHVTSSMTRRQESLKNSTGNGVENSHSSIQSGANRSAHELPRDRKIKNLNNSRIHHGKRQKRAKRGDLSV